MESPPALLPVPSAARGYMKYVVVMDPVEEVLYSIGISHALDTRGGRKYVRRLMRNLFSNRKRHIQGQLCASVLTTIPCAYAAACECIHVTPEGWSTRRLWCKSRSTQPGDQDTTPPDFDFDLISPTSNTGSTPSLSSSCFSSASSAPPTAVTPPLTALPFTFRTAAPVHQPTPSTATPTLSGLAAITSSLLPLQLQQLQLQQPFGRALPTTSPMVAPPVASVAPQPPAPVGTPAPNPTPAITPPYTRPTASPIGQIGTPFHDTSANIPVPPAVAALYYQLVSTWLENFARMEATQRAAAMAADMQPQSPSSPIPLRRNQQGNGWYGAF
eukprot:TRINITY_DN13569_c0_g1_i1.p1 TRINITY_DN13569_c0_g1~~TRINITY_DN13569_c0_g1_i1.p1  ORF type:complete len:353 (-),score=34.71 TRINITY_DN13569_c0_g1_i1:1759-2745(-)